VRAAIVAARGVECTPTPAQIGCGENQALAKGEKVKTPNIK